MNKKKIMKTLIIIAVLIIPVMYSFFYLKAFWDPYGNLQNMKVAIVNLDKGYETENLGNDLVENLKKNNTVKFIFLENADEAKKGLEDQEYYATITIPENFTQDLNSCKTTDKKTTTITYSPNQKYNYLASQIINQVTGKIETELRAEVSQKVVGNLSDSLKQIPNQMNTINDGANIINNGTKTLSEGLNSLNNGTIELSNKYTLFNQGIENAYNGSNELDSGINELNNGISEIANGSKELKSSTENLEELSNGINKITNATTQVTDGVNQYVSGVNNAISNISKSQDQIKTLSTDIQKYVESHPEIAQDSSFQKILKDLKEIQNSSSQSSNLNTLQTKGKELKQGTDKLKTNMQNFAITGDKINKLQNGIQNLNTGILKLQNGAKSLQTGSKSLNNGLLELKTNSNSIQNAFKTLGNGTNDAYEGSKKLVEGTDSFTSEINKGVNEAEEKVNTLDGLEEFVKEPVSIKEEPYAKVDSYGVGFAPYFISISLWVGALIALVMFYGDEEKRFKLLGKESNNKVLRTFVYLGISVIQGLVLGFLLKLGLGFEVTNIWLYYSTLILIGITFMSIEQFLIINFKDIGKFLCILLLVLQLAASAGTFPIETVPNIFKSIYKFMPMNYTIKLIKEALIQIQTNYIIKNSLVLIFISLCFILITLIIDFINKKRKIKE